MKANEFCLFCKAPVNTSNSFRHVDPETGIYDYFHMKCFKEMVNQMLKKYREDKCQ